MAVVASFDMRDDDFRRSLPMGRCVVVTPSDTDEIAAGAEYLYIGSAGDICFVPAGAGQTSVTWTVAAGTYIWCRVKQVKSTNTTGGLKIHACY